MVNNIKTKEREIIENFLIEKGKLFQRNDLINNDFQNSDDNAILNIAERVKSISKVSSCYSLVFKLPIFGEGDQISRVEISIYMNFIHYMLERMHFKEIIGDYYIIFNYFISDYADREGNMLKIGSLRSVVVFNKPENLEKNLNNFDINYNWLINNTNSDYVFPYLLFTGYAALFLDVFYGILKQNASTILNQSLSEREIFLKQIFEELLFTSGGANFFKDKFKILLENYTKKYVSNNANKVGLVKNGLLRKHEVIQYYKKDSNLHLHRNFEIYSCVFVSEDFYNEINSLKVDPVVFQQNKERIINEFKEKNKTISMPIDWRHFLSLVYAFENSVLIDQKNNIVFSDIKDFSHQKETWFNYKTVFPIKK